MRKLLLTTALMLPSALWAQDTALVLGVERYEQLDRVRGADDLLDAADRLEALGFVVHDRANPRVDAAKDLAAAFQADLETADRLVVALSGHFVTDGTRTWLLTAEGTGPDLFTVDEEGLSVDSLLRILAARPGKAVLLMGVADEDDLDMQDSALQPGIGQITAPQGVTIIRTTPSIAASTLATTLTEPEAEIGLQLTLNPSHIITGYLPLDWQLMPGEVIVDTRPASTPSEDLLNAEAALWDQTTAADTVEAYRRYIARFPEGRFVEDAEAQITAILAEPNRDARLGEEALNLNRNARRDIQANLTLLNFNTRGVDGIFGPGTRGAITNWQQLNGFPQTSYLTADQISLLDAQAARRQAEIEAEEARARAAEQERDRTYWAETGARGDEPGYRAYLDRYPQGLFANIATARLAAIEDQRRSAAEAADRAAWSIADSENTVKAYQEYLAAYPRGVFADQARGRIERLSARPGASDDQIERSRQQEASLRLSGVRAQLLELRLQELGHLPGRIDGVIDTSTRRAIAAYQASQGLPETGYVDTQTAVGLMTGSITITVPGR